MDWTVWAYFGFVTVLAATFLGIILYFYGPARKEKVEKPKYKMLEEDD
ncbi:MAG TPA: cbb3-type cytochrome c oxidase subunit 3 [Nitrospirae bacterium]|nr:cbb3-type cytochrome c oxidase subunit 3 [Nitrospirota bacterium]